MTGFQGPFHFNKTIQNDQVSKESVTVTETETENSGTDSGTESGTDSGYSIGRGISSENYVSNPELKKRLANKKVTEWAKRRIAK